MYSCIVDLVKFLLNYSVVEALLNDSTTFYALSFNRATWNAYAYVIFYVVESSRITLRKPKLIEQYRTCVIHVTDFVKFRLIYGIVEALLNDSTTVSTISFNWATSNLCGDVIFYTVVSLRITLRKLKLIKQDRCNTYAILRKN